MVDRASASQSPGPLSWRNIKAITTDTTQSHAGADAAAFDGPWDAPYSRELAIQYGQERANETRRAYVLTGLGHVMLMAGNGPLIEELGGIAKTFLPQANTTTQYSS